MGWSWSDHQHAVGVGSVNDVAGIHQAQADYAGYRRGNVAIGNVELGGLQQTLIVLDCSLVLFDQGLLGGKLLFGNRFLGEVRVV